ncbi:hypothetical protein B0H13DRAFT_2282850 [Mycena leptocephala]|nr:hypothetical protein B0H13DRAFT_2282850 [Mycena leptocephala]
MSRVDHVPRRATELGVPSRPHLLVFASWSFGGSGVGGGGGGKGRWCGDKTESREGWLVWLSPPSLRLSVRQSAHPSCESLSTSVAMSTEGGVERRWGGQEYELEERQEITWWRGNGRSRGSGRWGVGGGGLVRLSSPSPPVGGRTIPQVPRSVQTLFGVVAGVVELNGDGVEREGVVGGVELGSDDEATTLWRRRGDGVSGEGAWYGLARWSPSIRLRQQPIHPMGTRSSRPSLILVSSGRCRGARWRAASREVEKEQVGDLARRCQPSYGNGEKGGTYITIDKHMGALDGGLKGRVREWCRGRWREYARARRNKPSTKERTPDGCSRARSARGRGVFEGVRYSRAREKSEEGVRTWQKEEESETCLRERDRVSLSLA